MHTVILEYLHNMTLCNVMWYSPALFGIDCCDDVQVFNGC